MPIIVPIYLKGKLNARYYYIHAEDYVRDGEWAGKALMCVKNKSFTIKNAEKTVLNVDLERPVSSRLTRPMKMIGRSALPILAKMETISV